MEKQRLPFKLALLRAAVMSFACIFGCLGTTIFYISRSGSMPFMALQEVLNAKTGISFVTINLGLNIVFALVFLVRDRQYFHLGTIVALFISPLMMDGYAWLLRDFLATDYGMVGYWLIPILGALFLGFGMSMFFTANRDIGCAPTDMPLMWLQESKGWSFQKAYILMQGIWFVLGVALGGAWGWGTIVALFLQGYVTEFFMKHLTRKPVLKLTKQYDKLVEYGYNTQEEVDAMQGVLPALAEVTSCQPK